MGREKEVKVLRNYAQAKDNKRNVVQVTGATGVGKSEIISKAFPSTDSLVYRINVQSSESLYSGLFQLGCKMGLLGSVSGNEGESLRARVIQDTLEVLSSSASRYTPWILIFDIDSPDPAIVDDILQLSPKTGGTVILVTRTRISHKEVEATVTIPEHTQTEAYEYLEKRGYNGDKGELVKIAGSHPRALHYLVDTLQFHHMTPRMFKETSDLSQLPGLDTDVKVLALSLKEAEKTHPNAIAILHQLAFLTSCDRVPFNLLFNEGNLSPDDLKNLDFLHKHNLVTKVDFGTRTIIPSHYVAEIFPHLLATESPNSPNHASILLGLIRNMVCVLREKDGALEDTIRRERLLPTAVELLNKAGGTNLSLSFEVCNMRAEMGSVYHALREPEAQLGVLKPAWDLLKNQGSRFWEAASPVDGLKMRILGNLSEASARVMDFAAAKSFLAQYEKLVTSKRGRTHAEYATYLLNHFNTTYLMEKRNTVSGEQKDKLDSQLVDEGKEVIRLIRSHPNHSNLQPALQDVGTTFRDLGRNDEAVAFLSEAVIRNFSSLGPLSSAVVCYQLHLGLASGAEKWLLQQYDLINSYSRVVSTSHETREETDALKRVREKELSLEELRNLGYLLQTEGHWSEAEECFKEGLSRPNISAGMASMIRHELVVVQLGLKKYAQAKETLQSQLRSFGETTTFLFLLTHATLAYTQRVLGNEEEAAKSQKIINNADYNLVTRELEGKPQAKSDAVHE